MMLKSNKKCFDSIVQLFQKCVETLKGKIVFFKKLKILVLGSYLKC